MGGVSSNAVRPLAALFGAEQEANRGPTLASALVRSPEGTGWRLLLVTPLRVQAFDAQTAQPITLEESAVTSAMMGHAPFTACCLGEESSASSDSAAAGGGPSNSASIEPGNRATQLLAIGRQDGVVIVFAIANGSLTGPLYELKVAGEQPRAGAEDGAEASLPALPGCLAMSVTALLISGQDIFAGTSGRCHLWDSRSGELRREFHLPAGELCDSPVTPGALCVVRGLRGDAEGTQLWIGLDNGNIAVFDVQSGVLVRSFSCAGTEAVVSLALFPANAFVFALSAHRRVSVWDAASFAFLQKYPAELITCGADLSAMTAIDLPGTSGSTDPDIALLLLAGIDGSVCIRRVGRRHDGKINCVLLCYIEGVSGNPGCPITAINYHAGTDSALLGDAGCMVSLLSPLREQLGNSTTEIPRLSGGAQPPPAPPSVSAANAANASPEGEQPAQAARKEEQEAHATVVDPEVAASFPVFSG